MTTVGEICQAIEQFAPPSLQENYDNCGLLVGNPDATASGALLCIDVTQEVINEAIDKNCNLIVSHHPLIFGSLKRLADENETQRVVAQAIRQNINIFAAHTNIDSVLGGVSGRMAQKIGLTNILPLETRKGVLLENRQNEVGFGVVGVLPQAMTAVEFLTMLKTVFNVPTIRHTAICREKIKKVAMCGGAGSFLIEEAKKAATDIFISSDMKYHDFFLAENQLIIADIGHYESEQFTKEIFYDMISKKFPTFAARISEVNTNPINYF